MSRIRIAFVSTVHPHPWNPTKGTFNRVLLEGIARQVEVNAIVPVPWTERRGHRGLVPTSYAAAYPTYYYIPRIAPMALARQLAWSLQGCLRKLAPPDVVMGYWTDPDGTVAVRWAARIGRPSALIVGGSDVMLMDRKGGRRSRILDTLRRTDRIFTIGQRIREVLLDDGIDPGKVCVFSRGVDRATFRPGDRASARAALRIPADRPILLWVGRMVRVKGLDVLLDALSQPMMRSASPLVLLAGDGPDRASLVARAEALGISELVRFIGPVPHEELPSLYQAADLVVLPSRSEGVPNVLLESIACGTPFVASDVGSIRDLTTRPELCLVPPERPDLLAVAITRALEVGWRPEDWVAVPDCDAAAGLLALQLAGLAAH